MLAIGDLDVVRPTSVAPSARGSTSFMRFL
jgi:hypothetical protein